jgi:hypothetical protein
MALNGAGWMVIYSAVNSTCCGGQGIGLAFFGSDFSPTVRWLTSTDGTQERDPVMALAGTLPTGGRRYLAGWRRMTGGEFYLGVIDSSGALIQGPEEVSAVGIRWGNRDDSFRSRADGTVLWAAGNARSDTVNLYRYSPGSGTSVEPDVRPGSYSLEQNFPNPFNPTTVIGYQLPVASDVRLVVLDLLGREVAVLVNERKPAGTYTARLDAPGLASGVYFCRLTAGEYTATRKMILMR